MDQGAELTRQAESQRQMQPGPLPTCAVTGHNGEQRSRAAVGHEAPGLLGYPASAFGPPGPSGSSESRPRLWTLPSVAQEQAFCSPGGAAPSSPVQNWRYLYDDKGQTVRLQGLPLQRENRLIWEKPQWAWAFAFSTFPSRFYSLGCLPHFLVPGGQMAPWRRCEPVAQAASVKS